MIDNGYVYQNWFRANREMQSEEDTLWYYRNLPYPDHLKQKGRVAKAFAKTFTEPEQWARYAYENNLPFEICRIVDREVVSCFELDTIGDITIAFLDENLRLFMYYVFREQPNGMLFCIGMMFWEYPKDSTGDDDDTKSWTYTFEPNGNVKVIEREKGAEEEAVWTSKRPLNVQANWEPRPAFGDWDGLFNMKRWAVGELDEAFRGVPEGTGMKRGD